MNLFTHIANAPVAKSPLADAASLGHAAARTDQAGLNQQDFSKYLHQLLEAKAAAKPLDTQRQDLAGADHLASAHAVAAERHDIVARDARFDAPKARHSSEPDAGQARERTQDTDHAQATAPKRSSAPFPEAASTQDAAPEHPEVKPDDFEPNVAGLAASDGLKAVHLSPQIQVITSDTPATTDASLAAFARSMGMSEGTIQHLLGGTAPGETPSSVLPPATASAMTDPSQTAPTNAPVTAWPAGSLLQSLMGRQNANLPANPLSDMSTAGLAAQASPPQHLQAAMLEGLDQVSLQMGAMPIQAVAAQAQAALPNSTLAVLSMLDTQFSPEAVDSLQKEFDALQPSTASEDHMPQGLGAGPMSVKNTAGSNLPANALSAATQATHMAEAYEKLSDKLATELAARLHQQISDGQWKMKFALKPASLGAVDIQLEMKDGKLAALFQADNPMTQDLLQNGSQRLKDALHSLGMSQTSVQVGQGQSQAQSQGQSHTSSDAAKFGDNRGQTQDIDPQAPAEIGHRRSSDSQFDIYA